MKLRALRLIAFASSTLLACSSPSMDPDVWIEPPHDSGPRDDGPRDVSPDRPDVFDAGFDAEAAVTCALDGVYAYGYEGGLTVSTDQSALAPARSYTRRRTYARDADAAVECTVPLPGCDGEAGEAITAGDVAAAIADPDVQTALRASDGGDGIVYGRDDRALDGQVFAFRAGDGRGFYVGRQCMGSAGCREVPSGLARLTALLIALDDQQLANDACAGLR